MCNLFFYFIREIKGYMGGSIAHWYNSNIPSDISTPLKFPNTYASSSSKWCEDTLAYNVTIKNVAIPSCYISLSVHIIINW